MVSTRSLIGVPLLDCLRGFGVLVVRRVVAVLTVHRVEVAFERVDVRAAHEVAFAAAFLAGFCIG